MRRQIGVISTGTRRKTREICRARRESKVRQLRHLQANSRTNADCDDMRSASRQTWSAPSPPPQERGRGSRPVSVASSVHQLQRRAQRAAAICGRDQPRSNIEPPAQHCPIPNSPSHDEDESNGQCESGEAISEARVNRRGNGFGQRRVKEAFATERQ